MPRQHHGAYMYREAEGYLKKLKNRMQRFGSTPPAAG